MLKLNIAPKNPLFSAYLTSERSYVSNLGREKRGIWWKQLKKHNSTTLEDNKIFLKRWNVHFFYIRKKEYLLPQLNNYMEAINAREDIQVSVV